MILLKNGYVVECLSGTVEKKDILIRDGRILKTGRINLKNKRIKSFDLSGKFVIPGVFDIHVHTRVPGKEYAEDLLTLSRAAAAGGVCRIVAMPNTLPVIDNSKIIKKIIEKSKKEAAIEIFQSCAITVLEEGKFTVDFDELSRYTSFFTDDGKWVAKSSLMFEAMKRVSAFGGRIFSHPQFPHEVKDPLNIPSYTEYIAVWRDCMLSLLGDYPLHLQHISSRLSCQIIKQAKKLNRNITAETCPHYIWFTKEDVKDANFKMNPPLRTHKDKKAIIDAVKDGTIDVIASDHAPHSFEEKSLGLKDAPYGVIGLETLLPASIDKLYIEEKMPLVEVIKKFTLNPARVCGFNDYGCIKEGSKADLCVFSFEEWVYRTSFSKSKNSPFLGFKFKTKVNMTFKEAKLIYENGKFNI